MTQPETVPALPPHWYCSDAIFELETRNIFAREWTAIGPVSDLAQAGSLMTATIAGTPIVVVRQHTGTLGAFLNICRHRSGTLVAESDNAARCRNFSCPYHGWVYDLDGTLTHAPGFESSDGFDFGDYSLATVRVDIWNGIVFATLNDDGPSLLEWLGDIDDIAKRFPRIDEMAFHSTVRNRGDVDWKTYSDNSAEGYHLEYVHPGLSRVVAPGSEIKAWPRGRFIGFDVSYQNENREPTGKGFWVYKFPGLLLHFSEHGFNMERVIATAPGKSEMQRWFWFTEGSTDPQSAVDASTQVMHEDFQVCESVQRNLESGGARTGILSMTREPGTVYFQQLVREAIEAEVER